VPQPRPDRIPLSHGQRRLWLIQRLPPHYTGETAVSVGDPPSADIVAAERGWSDERKKLEQEFNDLKAAKNKDTVKAESVAQRRFVLVLVGIFGVLALTLAAIGVYGVMSLLVSERTQEVGVRLALGAHPADVLRMLVGQATRLALVGVAAGVALSSAVMPLLGNQLYGVQPRDPMTLAGVPIDIDQVETNFVQVDVGSLGMDGGEAIERLLGEGIRVSGTVLSGRLRAVTHLGITDEDIELAIEAIPRGLGVQRSPARKNASAAST